MSLSSRGCSATISEFIESVDNKIKVEITCYMPIIKNGKKDYISDFKGRVVIMNPNNEILYRGDQIYINGFYIKNREGRRVNQFDTITITDWKIKKRNSYVRRYYKRPTNAEVLEAKRRQRQAIEEEIEAEEQDIDEYIDNNGTDDIPF